LLRDYRFWPHINIGVWGKVQVHEILALKNYDQNVESGIERGKERYSENQDSKVMPSEIKTQYATA
jgi:hypothetical protein